VKKEQVEEMAQERKKLLFKSFAPLRHNGLFLLAMHSFS